MRPRLARLKLAADVLRGRAVEMTYTLHHMSEGVTVTQHYLALHKGESRTPIGEAFTHTITPREPS
jgi:hypothetical protein